MACRLRFIPVGALQKDGGGGRQCITIGSYGARFSLSRRITVPFWVFAFFFVLVLVRVDLRSECCMVRGYSQIS